MNALTRSVAQALPRYVLSYLLCYCRCCAGGAAALLFAMAVFHSFLLLFE